MIHLNLYKNGPLALGFDMPLNYFFTVQVLFLFFSCDQPLIHLNLHENSPLVVGFEMLPDFSLLQVLSLLYFFQLWRALDISEPVWERPSGGWLWGAAQFFCYYYYTSSVSVFQLQWVLDASEPVQERPSGSCFFVTIHVLSVFFSCNKPLMRLNLHENGPLAVGFEVLPDFVAMQVLSLCAARLLVTASSVCVFQMQWAFDASEPVRERPSGGGLWGAARLHAVQRGHLPPHWPHRRLHSLRADQPCCAGGGLWRGSIYWLVFTFCYFPFYPKFFNTQKSYPKFFNMQNCLCNVCLNCSLVCLGNPFMIKGCCTVLHMYMEGYYNSG